MDENRKDFEAYVTGKQFRLPADAIRRDPETGEYDDSQTQDFWLVWRAARADVMVELPAPKGWLTDAQYYRGVNDCRDAIHAAGIRTR